MCSSKMKLFFSGIVVKIDNIFSTNFVLNKIKIYSIKAGQSKLGERTSYLT